MAGRSSFNGGFINHWIFAADCFTDLRQLRRVPRGKEELADRRRDHLAARRAQCRGSCPTPSAAGARPSETARRRTAAVEAPPLLAMGLLRRFGALLLVTLIWLIVTAPLEPRAGAARRSGDAAAQSPRASRSPGAARSRTQPVDVAKLDPLTPGGLHRHRGPPLPPPLGHRPARHRPGDGRQLAGRRGAAGRQHAHPAAGQDQLPVVRPLLKRKAQEVIIAFWLEGWLTKDEILSRYLSQRLFRRWRLWPARRLAPLFRPRAGAI